MNRMCSRKSHQMNNSRMLRLGCYVPLIQRMVTSSLHRCQGSVSVPMISSLRQIKEMEQVAPLGKKTYM